MRGVRRTSVQLPDSLRNATDLVDAPLVGFHHSLNFVQPSSPPPPPAVVRNDPWPGAARPPAAAGHATPGEGRAGTRQWRWRGRQVRARHGRGRMRANSRPGPLAVVRGCQLERSSANIASRSALPFGGLNRELLAACRVDRMLRGTKPRGSGREVRSNLGSRRMPRGRDMAAHFVMRRIPGG